MGATFEKIEREADLSGITIRWADLGTRHGQYEPPTTIVLNPHRPLIVQTCTLAHELAHHQLGHRPTADPVLRARQEVQADRFAAQMLVSPLDFERAELLTGGHTAALARELGVVSWVVRAYRQVLAAA